MNLAGWAERNGVARVSAYRGFHAGRLPVSAQRVGRLILVSDAAAEPVQHRRTAVYAWVCSAGQRADLDREVARVAAWATTEQIPVTTLSTGIGSAGSALSMSKPRFAAQGRELVVVDAAQVDDDLVRDMTEILTSMCARRYGKRAAAHRANRAMAAANDGEAP